MAVVKSPQQLLDAEIKSQKESNAFKERSIPEELKVKEDELRRTKEANDWGAPLRLDRKN